MTTRNFFFTLTFLLAVFSMNAQTVTDVNGNVYQTVVIGRQVWMAGNLKAISYRDNTSIPKVPNNTQWSNLTAGAYCWYNNDSLTYSQVYGALYNWKTVESGKLCPAGWHVPAKAEYDSLSSYLGGSAIAGGKMKETGTSHWDSPNTGATNSSGFSSVPGGYRNVAGTFDNLRSFGYYWTATESSATNAIHMLMLNSASQLNDYGAGKLNGYSVRCLRDLLTTVDERNNHQEFRIYPNPFKFSATVNLTTTNAVVVVYNLYGQKVRELNHFSTDKVVFSRDNLPEGIYFMYLIQDYQIIARDRFIIAD